MIYLTRTLKEINWTTISTDFVFETEDVSLVKKFLDTKKIIVLSLTEVPNRPNSGRIFWNIQLDETTTLKFCLNSQDTRSAIERVISLGLPLIDINDIKEPLPEEEVQQLIESFTNEENKRQEIEAEARKKAQSKKNKITTDEKRDRIITVVNSTIEDINRIQTTYVDNVTLKKYNTKLTDIRNELTKIKMGSNLVRATPLLEEAFKIMEDVEITHVSDLEQDEYAIDDSSTISNIDIINELDKIKRAQQVTQIGGKKTTSDLYYTYLWLSWLYQKFITKDIISKIREVNNMIPAAMRYVDFGIVSITLSVGIIFLYSHVAGSWLTYQTLLSMTFLWIWCLARELIAYRLPYRSHMALIGRLVLAIILTIIIYKAVVIYFALL